MQLFSRPIIIAAMFCFLPTIKPVSVEHYYDFVMQTVLRTSPFDQEKVVILSKIINAGAASNAALVSLMHACENDLPEIPKEFIPPLYKYGFIDANGTIDSKQDAVKALKEITLHIKADNRLITSKKIDTSLIFCQFLNVYIKSLSNKNKGPYQETLSLFTFTFPNYHDLLQLLAEAFIEKDYYFKASNNTPLIIDCGGNLGISVIFFKTLYPEAQIITFEPSHICLPFLRKNISDNHLNGVTIINKAVVNKKGQYVFHEAPTNTLGGGLIGNPNDKSAIVVDSVLLSDYIKGPVDFLKVDIEGAELLVFEDLDQSGKIKLIKEMAIECHSSRLLHAVLNILNRHDFVYQVKKEELWGDAFLVHAFNRDTTHVF